ncbi:hypothetical protein L0244_10780 [bacterium]|nr:hypothetical protein [bacterium]MCI0613464.1 hypothetical protein [bacterium]
MSDGIRFRGGSSAPYNWADEGQAQAGPKDQEREVGKEYPKKDKDPKVPEKTVKGTRVQVPKPSRGDESLEGGPNSKDVARRQDDARRPDDRDLDPKVKAEEKRNKMEGSARNHVDPQNKKGMDEATGDAKREKARQYDAREQMIREQGDKIIGKPKPKHMPGFSK